MSRKPWHHAACRMLENRFPELRFRNISTDILNAQDVRSSASRTLTAKYHELSSVYLTCGSCGICNLCVCWGFPIFCTLKIQPNLGEQQLYFRRKHPQLRTLAQH